MEQTLKSTKKSFIISSHLFQIQNWHLFQNYMTYLKPFLCPVCRLSMPFDANTTEQERTLKFLIYSIDFLQVPTNLKLVQHESPASNLIFEPYLDF